MQVEEVVMVELDAELMQFSRSYVCARAHVCVRVRAGVHFSNFGVRDPTW